MPKAGRNAGWKGSQSQRRISLLCREIWTNTIARRTPHTARLKELVWVGCNVAEGSHRWFLQGCQPCSSRLSSTRPRRSLQPSVSSLVSLPASSSLVQQRHPNLGRLFMFENMESVNKVCLVGSVGLVCWSCRHAAACTLNVRFLVGFFRGKGRPRVYLRAS